MQDKILEDLKAAMLAGEKDKVEVLRMVKSALQMAEIDNKDGFDEVAQLKVVQKEAKKRTDAAQMYKDAGEEERAQAELDELAIIEEYLPEKMSDDDIAAVVDEVIAKVGSDNMGAIMGQVMAKLGGQADGGTVSRIVKEKMN